MNHFRAMIAIVLFCAVALAQAQKSIKPASIFHDDGITFMSPNQSGWTLLRTHKSDTAFEKRSEDEIATASVKIVQTKTFATDKDRLEGWEILKQEELSPSKRDSIHFNFRGFKGAMCLQYDGKFLIEKTSTLNFAYLNFEGYLCPHPRAKDLAMQIEFST
jgi:hypothetical protein